MFTIPLTEVNEFQSPKNRVIVPDLDWRAVASSCDPYEFQSPKNRVIVPNQQAASWNVGYEILAKDCFNPLKIGS